MTKSNICIMSVTLGALVFLLSTPASANHHKASGPSASPVGTLFLPELEPMPLFDVAFNTVGSDVGAAMLDPISITKSVDPNSPTIFASLTSGIHLASAQIVLFDRRSGDTKLHITLDNLRILGQTVLAERDEASGEPRETVVLRARRATLEANGMSVCWDFQTNAACAP